MELKALEKQIISALSHPEAEEGLYLKNFSVLHEEDERPRVAASDEDILNVLKILMEQGKVITQESGEDVAFLLSKD